MQKIIPVVVCFSALAFTSAAQTTETQNTVIHTSANKTDTLFVGSNPGTSEAEFFTTVEEMPEYAGGTDALMKFIGRNTMYPDSARSNNIEGKLYVSFIIEPDGRSTEHKIIRGIHPLLDAEALRVCRLITYEKGGKQSGKPVRVQYTLPLKFTLK